ncbi:MAG: hypothetical protein K2N94_08965 [Lachnospiraceae bacterium]|nr:hypothetical protein [Lachnospiraceae bacterium]
MNGRENSAVILAPVQVAEFTADVGEGALGSEGVPAHPHFKIQVQGMIDEQGKVEDKFPVVDMCAGLDRIPESDGDLVLRREPEDGTTEPFQSLRA